VFNQGETIEARINPPDSIVRMILVGYNPKNFVTGFKLFDKNKVCLLEIGSFKFETKKVYLDEEDRILGFRSRLHLSKVSFHNSLVIVTGRRTA
jgi:hypothetical protein